MIMIFLDRDKMYGEYDKAHWWTFSIDKQSDGVVALSHEKSKAYLNLIYFILTTCFYHLSSFRSVNT